MYYINICILFEIFKICTFFKWKSLVTLYQVVQSFFLIVVADLRGLFTNKCMLYISIPLILFDSALKTWTLDSNINLCALNVILRTVTFSNILQNADHLHILMNKCHSLLVFVIWTIFSRVNNYTTFNVFFFITVHKFWVVDLFFLMIKCL